MTAGIYIAPRHGLNMEEFKSLEEIITVDARNTYFVLRNRITGETRPQELKDHYESINAFTLNETVPEKVRSHFNTAKNALLYTWFVYGFYPVAELQALSALELALREQIGEEGLKKLKKQKKQLGMRTFIEHAVENKWIENEDFSAYHRAHFSVRVGQDEGGITAIPPTLQHGHPLSYSA